MRTSNPVLREEVFSAPSDVGFGAQLDSPRAQTRLMTMNGTIVKTGVLLLLCIVSALLAASSIEAGWGIPPKAFYIGGALGGFVLGLFISFVPKSAPFLSPVYAILQGAFLGAISLAFSGKMQGQASGMVLQAVCLTFGIFGALLAAYSFGLIRVGSTFARCIIVGTIGIALTYLASFVLSMFGITVLSSAINGSGWLGIGFSLVVVVLASLNLVLDFQFVEGGVRSGAPKYMEWYAGFGLLVTLVWLYLEILRLLSKLNRR